MGKYLITASYTPEGAKGLLKEGGSSRKAQIESILTGLGGKMETFYYSIEKFDVFVIADIPDKENALALNLTINSTGMVKIIMTPLLEAEEIDKACKIPVHYRVPGQ